MSQRVIAWFVAGVLSVAAVSPAFAATTGTAKIGYLDVAKVFDAYEKSKSEEKALEEASNKKQAEREKIVSQVKKLREELELLSDKGKDEKQVQVDEQLARLQEFDTQARNDLRRQRDAVAREILKEIDGVVKDYAQKEGFTVILNDRVLLYGASEYDLTEQVIKTLNARYGGKDGKK